MGNEAAPYKILNVSKLDQSVRQRIYILRHGSEHHLLVGLEPCSSGSSAAASVGERIADVEEGKFYGTQLLSIDKPFGSHQSEGFFPCLNGDYFAFYKTRALVARLLRGEVTTRTPERGSLLASAFRPFPCFNPRARAIFLELTPPFLVP